MEHKYPAQASSFLTEGTISLDDIRMSLESSPDEESQGFDMTSYLDYEVLHFPIKRMHPLCKQRLGHIMDAIQR
jgi:hypothetical protein